MALEFTACPDLDCQAPAEVVDRYAVESTAGPVVHVATVCVRRHHYTTPEEDAPCP